MKGGDIFYSPNCAREVDVPQPLPYGANPLYPEMRADGRHNIWDLDPSIYTRPAWWTIAFGWLAFFQLSDRQLDFALLSALSCTRMHYSMGDSGYRLSPHEMNKWNCIDRQLAKASRLLADHYTLYTMLPFEPWQFGYLRSHPRHGALMVCLDKARRWFPVYLARLSYLVAGAETREAQLVNYPSLARLHWIELLSSHGADVGIDKRWTDLLMDTTVASYAPVIERAGIFLQLVHEHSLQPTVAWYCLYGVPVWYPWGSEEAKLHRLEAYAPLPHQLQEATTFITRSPIDISNETADPAIDENNRKRSIKKMEDFFKARALRNERKLASETSEGRQKRLQREQRPPRVSAVLYLWKDNGDGEYERFLIDRKDRDDMFEDYSDEQMRYDSFQNEWNVCELWGESVPDFDNTTGAEFYPGDDRESLPDLVLENIAPAIEDGHPIACRLSSDDSTIPERFETEVLNVLSVYFGYTPLIPPTL